MLTGFCPHLGFWLTLTSQLQLTTCHTQTPPASSSWLSVLGSKMDYAASRRVQQLITTLTDPKASTLDADKLAECKALLKQSEALVAYGVPLLIDRLGASHSQVKHSN